jgi:hypothetical protein
MTPQEAAQLLAVCAAFDNRKPDPDAAQAWMLALDGLDYLECRNIIVQHYRESREWIMPADVVSGVKALRKQRFDDFRRAYGNLMPPAHLDADPAKEAAWMRESYERIRAGKVTHPDQLGENSTVANLPRRDVIAEFGTVGRELA